MMEEYNGALWGDKVTSAGINLLVLRDLDSSNDIHEG